MFSHSLEKEPSQKQKAQQKYESVYNNFDKTHKILYPECEPEYANVQKAILFPLFA